MKQNPTTHLSTSVVQSVCPSREIYLEGPVLDPDGGGVVPLEVTRLSMAEVDKLSKRTVSEMKTWSVTIESSRDSPDPSRREVFVVRYTSAAWKFRNLES